MPEPVGTTLESTQMMKRSITGNPVFPMMMKNHMTIMMYSEVLNEFMLSGVKVKPKSIKAEFDVKKAHQTLETPASSTMEA
jgi:hypothetical protein